MQDRSERFSCQTAYIKSWLATLVRHAIPALLIHYLISISALAIAFDHRLHALDVRQIDDAHWSVYIYLVTNFSDVGELGNLVWQVPTLILVFANMMSLNAETGACSYAALSFRFLKTSWRIDSFLCQKVEVLFNVSTLLHPYLSLDSNKSCIVGFHWIDGSKVCFQKQSRTEVHSFKLHFVPCSFFAYRIHQRAQPFHSISVKKRRSLIISLLTLQSTIRAFH